MTLMSLVTAAGEVLKPLLVHPGVQARYRKRSNGKYETASNNIPKPNFLYMRLVSGVDTKIFYSLAHVFVKETEHLQPEGSKVLLIMNGCLPCII